MEKKAQNTVNQTSDPYDHTCVYAFLKTRLSFQTGKHVIFDFLQFRYPQNARNQRFPAYSYLNLVCFYTCFTSRSVFTRVTEPPTFSKTSPEQYFLRYFMKMGSEIRNEPTKMAVHTLWQMSHAKTPFFSNWTPQVVKRQALFTNESPQTMQNTRF